MAKLKTFNSRAQRNAQKKPTVPVCTGPHAAMLNRYLAANYAANAVAWLPPKKARAF
tara:strand:- start:341 stop:511 length:171 start_codon:yes stop_codon:yes gene_type:complete